MHDTIKASEKALISVFCDDYVFNIPSYQRPYAWKVKHAGQLLDGIHPVKTVLNEAWR